LEIVAFPNVIARLDRAIQLSAQTHTWPWPSPLSSEIQGEAQQSSNAPDLSLPLSGGGQVGVVARSPHPTPTTAATPPP